MKKEFQAIRTSIFFLFLVYVWSTAAYSICMPVKWDEQFERADVVFAAELRFSHMGFIPYPPSPGLYQKKDFYQYRTMHVWKGDPGPEGIAYQASSDMISLYDFPAFLPDELDRSEQRKKQPASTLIIYGYHSKHGLVYGGCAGVPEYHHAFSLRLDLGTPEKSYNDYNYMPLSSAQIFDYLAHTMTQDDEALMMSYHGLEDAMLALVTMKRQHAMLAFLEKDEFMNCRQSWASLAVMSNLIRNLSEYAQSLHDKFRFMLSCSEVESRIKIFSAFSNIVSSAELFKMIRHAMLDPSTRFRKIVAGSVFRLDDTDRQWFLEHAEVMLASSDPLERMFAAVMLVRMPEIDSYLVAAVCQAEPAKWQYNIKFDYSESMSDQCQRLQGRPLHNRAIRDSDSPSSGRVVSASDTER